MIDIFRSVGEYHFVITGNTNDHFCANSLTETDLLRMLCERLLSEKFDAVVFFDSKRGLYVYDRHSKEVLDSFDAYKPDARCADTGAKRGGSGSGSSASRWDRVVSLLSCKDKDCAVVFSDIGSLHGHVPEKVLRALKELSKMKSAHHPIAIYIFREDIAKDISESLKNGTKVWRSFVRNQLGPIIGGLGSPVNGGRVLCVGTPGQTEIRAMLVFMEHCRGIAIPRRSHKEISLALARYCAENRMGLSELCERLAALAKDGVLDPETVMSEFALSDAPELAAEADGFGGLTEFFAADGGDVRLSDSIGSMHESKCRLSRNFAADLGIARSINVRVIASENVDKAALAGLFARHFFRRGTLYGAGTRLISARELFAENAGDDRLLVDCTLASAFGETYLIYDTGLFITDERGKAVFQRLLTDVDSCDGRVAVMLLGSGEELERLCAADERLPDIFPIQVDLIEKHDAKESCPQMPDNIDSLNDKRSENEEKPEKSGSRKAVKENRTASGVSPEISSTSEKEKSDDDEPLLMDRVIEELDRMVGLSDVKQFVIRMAETVITSPTGQPLKNFCFVGVPGTGKTDFVTHFTKILFMLGMIKEDRIRSFDGAQLCLSAKDGKDIRRLLSEGQHGLLFIDEAYILDNGSDGKSVIDSLITISSDKDFIKDTAIVLSGYWPDIAQMMRHNVGLRSRFPSENFLQFKSYSASELRGILESVIKATDFRTSEKYLDRTEVTLMRFLCGAPMNFGNGRYIKCTYFPNSCNMLSERLKAYASKAGVPLERYVCSISDELRYTLTDEDIPVEMLEFAPDVGSDYKALLESSVAPVLVGKKSISDFIDEIGRMNSKFCSGSMRYYSISGPTGSGKKTSVTAISGALRRAGLLSADNVVSVTAVSLQGEYQGHTSPNVRKLLDNVSGGTIAIRDPSYLLQTNGDGGFGQEALSELFDQMSLRKDISVALIDTEEGISRLCAKYPTLNELLGNRFVIDEPDVPDYLELLKIKMAEESIRLDSEMSEKIDYFMEAFVAQRGGRPESWLYAGEIDRLVSDMVDCRRSCGSGGKKDYVVTSDNFPAKYKCWLNRDETVEEVKLACRDSVIDAFDREKRRIINMNDRSTGCYIFIGGHGTGKNAAASVFARMLHECGVIRYDGVILKNVAEFVDPTDNTVDSLLTSAGRGLMYIEDAHELVSNEGFAKKLFARFTDTEKKPKCCLVLGLIPSREGEFFGMFEKLDRMISEYHRFFFEDYDTDEMIELLKMFCDGKIKFDDKGSRPKFALTERFLSDTERIFRQICNERTTDSTLIWNARLIKEYVGSCIKESGLCCRDADGRFILDAKDIPSKYHVWLSRRPPQDRLTMGILTDADSRCGYDAARSYSFVYIEAFRHGILQKTGSGVIITGQGHVLTCGHIIGADRYNVSILSGNNELIFSTTAHVVYKSYSADFGILKLDVMSDKITPIKVRRESPEVGENVKIIGFPFQRQSSTNRYKKNLTDVISCDVETGSVTSVRMRSQNTENGSLSSNVRDGFSGAPVISEKDGELIGVICGSIRNVGTQNSKDCFYTCGAFWENVDNWIWEDNEEDGSD